MKKKILFAASTRGHVLHFHAPYLAELRAMGAEIHCAWAGSDEPAENIDRIIPLPLAKSMTAPGNFRAALLMRRLIRREGYDAVIVHTSLAAFFLRLALLGLKDRPRCMNMVHGYLFDDDSPRIKGKILLWAERICAPVTDVLLTMNRWDYELAREKRLGKKVELIPGVGVDFSAMDSAAGGLRQSLGIDNDAFVMIYPAEFSGRKNQSFLISLLPQLPENAVLVLPGAGEKLEQCRALAAELGLGKRVVFPGYVSGMGPWYDMADAAVSSSRSEGLPFNIMEAMHFGLPAVATAVKGHEDLIEHGVSGFLFPFGDEQACIEAIKRLAEEPALRRAMGEKARERAEGYSLEKVLPVVMEKYIEFLA